MYGSARELFEAASAASREAHRIAVELAAMEQDAAMLGSPGLGARVRSTGEPDRMAVRVAARTDRRERLEARQEECYRLIDSACEILYGRDNRSGLYAIVGWPADAIYHHYLALRTWDEVAELMGYSSSHVKKRVVWALELADANGDMWTRLGVGMAEG